MSACFEVKARTFAFVSDCRDKNSSCNSKGIETALFLCQTLILGAGGVSGVPLGSGRERAEKNLVHNLDDLTLKKEHKKVPSCYTFPLLSPTRDVAKIHKKSNHFISSSISMTS